MEMSVVCKLYEIDFSLFTIDLGVNLVIDLSGKEFIIEHTDNHY